jgi:hypothetical protein
VQQLPDEAAEAMGDGPNRLADAQTGRQPSEYFLKVAVFGLYGGEGHFGQNAPYRSIPFGGLPRAFLLRSKTRALSVALPTATARIFL